MLIQTHSAHWASLSHWPAPVPRGRGPFKLGYSEGAGQGAVPQEGGGQGRGLEWLHSERATSPAGEGAHGLWIPWEEPVDCPKASSPRCCVTPLSRRPSAAGAGLPGSITHHAAKRTRSSRAHQPRVTSGSGLLGRRVPRCTCSAQSPQQALLAIASPAAL